MTEGDRSKPRAAERARLSSARGNPRGTRTQRAGLWPAAPVRGLLTAILTLLCVVVGPGAVSAQPKAKPAPKATEKVVEKKDGKVKEKSFDFNNLQLNGQLRTPQLLYFLERANEELERASLEKRSFIPHMVRSVEEEAL